MDLFFSFIYEWGATILWTTLCLIGIFFGFFEVKESIKDIKNFKDNDLSKIVAKFNFKSSLKNIYVQIAFLLTAVFLTYLKLKYPIEFPVSFIRSILSPSLLLVAELILVLQLRDINNIRKEIKKQLVNEE